MTSRHTRRNAQGPLFTLTNEELAILEQSNRQQLRPTDTTMGDNRGHDDLTSAMTLMQQHMKHMQQTINTQEAARQAAAELAARQVEQQGAPIGGRNLPWNFPTTRSAINPLPTLDMIMRPSLLWSAWCRKRCSTASQLKFRWITSRILRESATSRANGVPPDYVKCTLFSFSLDGKAARWLASLPTGTLTTWEQASAAFLCHFYTKTKTGDLRHKISNFKQKTDEPFYDAWERYKEYQRECPHHGFGDDYILEVFYDRVSYEFRNALDSSSNGDFMTQTTPGAFTLMENMASSLLNKNKENDHSKSVYIYIFYKLYI